MFPRKYYIQGINESTIEKLKSHSYKVYNPTGDSTIAYINEDSLKITILDNDVLDQMMKSNILKDAHDVKYLQSKLNLNRMRELLNELNHKDQEINNVLEKWNRESFEKLDIEMDEQYKEYFELASTFALKSSISDMIKPYPKRFLDPQFLNELEFHVLKEEVSYVHSNDTDSINDFVEDLNRKGYFGMHNIYENDFYGTTICIDEKNQQYIMKPSSEILADSENLVESPFHYSERMEQENRYYKISDQINCKVKEIYYDLGQNENGFYSDYMMMEDRYTESLLPGDFIVTNKFDHEIGFIHTSLEHIDTSLLLNGTVDNNEQRYIKLIDKDFKELILQGSVIEVTQEEMENELHHFNNKVESERENLFHKMDIQMLKDDLSDITKSNTEFYLYKDAIYNNTLPGVVVTLTGKRAELYMVSNDETGVRLDQYEYGTQQSHDALKSWEAAPLSIRDAETLIGNLPDREEFVNFYSTLDPMLKKEEIVRQAMYRKIYNIANTMADNQILRAEVYVDLLESVDTLDDVFQSEGIAFLNQDYKLVEDKGNEMKSIEIKINNQHSIDSVKADLQDYIEAGVLRNTLSDITLTIQYEGYEILDHKFYTAEELHTVYNSSILNRTTVLNEILDQTGIIEENEIEPISEMAISA